MRNNNEDFYRDLEHKWKHFIDTGIILPGVRPEIAESWIRSRSYHVDINKAKAKQLPRPALDKLRSQYAAIIDVVMPVMEHMHELVRDTENLISLHTPDGYMLACCGDEYYNNNNDCAFILGVKWDEQSIGTNGVSLAVRLRSPVQVYGAEHYAKFQQRGTCSAAPIMGENGSILGVINIAGYNNTGSSHTLGLVTLAAFYVEKQLALIHSYQLINDTFSTIGDGLIVLDSDFRITRMNQSITKLFRCSEQDLLTASFPNFISSGSHEFVRDIKISTAPLSYPEMNLEVKNHQVSCNVTCTPTIVNNEFRGALLQIRESKAVNTLINHLVGNTARYSFSSIITQNEAIQIIINSMRNVAPTDCTILLQGESGTGKELFAHAIHNASNRKNKPFIVINCASLPHALIESELFGYEKGAFTGALGQGNPGKFELADGGSIFLDEIGELPLEIQAKLLRVLDTRRFYRIGGKKEKSVDVRVIAATNRNLLDEVNNYNFRADLYYRINVLSFNIPPLRQRAEDVPLLANHFLNELNLKNIQNLNAYKTFSQDFLDFLKHYDFPGNVRELQNIILRTFYRSGDDPVISKMYLSPTEQQTYQPDHLKPAINTPHSKEYLQITDALRKHNGNTLLAAKELGISRATYYRRMKELSINPKEYAKK